MKKIQSVWYGEWLRANGIAGVVLWFDDTMKYFQAYIGVWVGKDQEQDERHILKYWNKIDLKVALAIFGDFAFFDIDTYISYHLTDYYKTNTSKI